MNFHFLLLRVTNLYVRMWLLLFHSLTFSHQWDADRRWRVVTSRAGHASKWQGENSFMSLWETCGLTARWRHSCKMTKLWEDFNLSVLSRLIICLLSFCSLIAGKLGGSAANGREHDQPPDLVKLRPSWEQFRLQQSRFIGNWKVKQLRLSCSSWAQNTATLKKRLAVKTLKTRESHMTRI